MFLTESSALVRQRDCYGELASASRAAGLGMDRTLCPWKVPAIERDGVSLHCPVIAIELRLPGASRVGPVGASGSGWSGECAAPPGSRAA